MARAAGVCGLLEIIDSLPQQVAASLQHGAVLAFDNWVAGWVSHPLTRLFFSTGLHSHLFDNGCTDTEAWQPFGDDVNRRR